MNPVSIKVFASQLEESLTKEIERISAETSDEVVRYSRALYSVKKMIAELRRFAYSYQFKSRDEEIEFFKYIKPSALSQFFYYDALISFTISEPKDNIEKLKAYCEKQLASIQEFSNANLEFFKYCTSSGSYLDELYFIRKGEQVDDPNLDVQFSTGYDVILGRFIAGFLLIKFIEGRVQASSATPGSTLNWTSKKAHLVELIYALHKADVFNNGKADLKHIASTFESLFNVRLGNLYRQFQDISLRKTNRTVFIDELKEKLEERMDERD